MNKVNWEFFEYLQRNRIDHRKYILENTNCFYLYHYIKMIIHLDLKWSKVEMRSFKLDTNQYETYNILEHSGIESVKYFLDKLGTLSITYRLKWKRETNILLYEMIEKYKLIYLFIYIFFLKRLSNLNECTNTSILLLSGIFKNVSIIKITEENKTNKTIYFCYSLEQFLLWDSIWNKQSRSHG